ncbi:MAG: protein-export chaperone SecB [Clostridia bacterium]|nr:protein-export chaperone SecB [Clostridia bacterium]
MLKLLGYKVNEMKFKINAEAQNEKNFQINPKIRFDIKKGPHNLIMGVTVTIDKSQPTPVPFELNLNMVGSFQAENENDIEDLRLRATSALFPYVRAVITNITTNANIPAYYLPMIDFQTQNAKPHKNESVIIRPLEDLE